MEEKTRLLEPIAPKKPTPERQQGLSQVSDTGANFQTLADGPYSNEEVNTWVEANLSARENHLNSIIPE